MKWRKFYRDVGRCDYCDGVETRNLCDAHREQRKELRKYERAQQREETIRNASKSEGVAL